MERTNRLERLYAINEHIRRQRDRPVSATALAREFEVDALRRRIRTVDDATRSGAPVSARVRRTVEQAVRRGVVINVDYVDANGAETERADDALGFYRSADGWLLIGWCHLRDAGRIFRLDRMTTARLTRRPVIDRDVDETLGWVPSLVRAP